MHPFLTKLSGQTVLIGNKANFSKKLLKFVSEGPGSINLVTDFDYTMTRFTINGQRGYSCHRVLEECGVLGEAYQAQATALQRKYYPIEVNPDIPHDEKVQHMVDWVTQAHELLLHTGLRQQVLKDAVSKAIKGQRIGLRSKVVELLHAMTEANIPVLIFSAGIADILEEVLLYEMHAYHKALCNRDCSTGKTVPDHHSFYRLEENIHIVSNRCIFGDSNRVIENGSSTVTEVPLAEVAGNDLPLIGFELPVFHVFNKRASEVMHLTEHDASKYFSRGDLLNRTNLVLLGDSLGDLQMHEGLHHSEENMIRIGYLNDRPERLAEYLQAYDVVILGDPGFELPFELITSICKGSIENSCWREAVDV